jgi:mono/diheme cytochrome c family protein
MLRLRGRLVALAALAPLAAAAGAWPAATGARADAGAQRRPTFANDIAPMMLTRCASCHRPGGPAPFALLSYDDVKVQATEIVIATEARHMPPWHAAQGPGYPALLDDRRLSDRQIQALRTWVANGMPPGDLRRAPELPAFPAPWLLGLPDVTLTFERPVRVPAGTDTIWRNAVVPIGMPADLWIGAFDYQPATAGRVRHARLFLAPPGLDMSDADMLPGVGSLVSGGRLENYSDRLLAAGRGLIDLGAWSPGLPRPRLPDGLAVRVPVRSRLILQLHLRPGAEDAVEDGRVALYFAAPSARRPLIGLDVPPASGIATGLLIPAGDARFAATDSLTLPVAVDAVGARGWAHLLARELTMTATAPKGQPRGLLRIDRWDMNWPDTYYFAAPVRLAAGTTIQTTIVYDNSAANPRNLFLPPRDFGWGRPPGGEMMSMSLLVAPASDADALALRAAVHDRLLAQVMKTAGR